MNPSKYVLITAVRDEERTIGETLDSVMAQSQLPEEWVIVSDGSVDRTDEMVRAAAAKAPFIKLLQLPFRPERSFGAMVNALRKGVDHLTCKNYEFIGLLDGDIRMPQDYFENVIKAFKDSPSLGLAGGMAVDLGESAAIPRNTVDVPGAVQFFRRACYEGVNGYFLIPEGGFDSVACAHARMLGYETRLLTSLVVDHLKPRNISAGGVVRRQWQLGKRDYAMGSHAAFQVVKCFARLRETPVIIGGIARLFGFLSCIFKSVPRVVPPELISFVQREQLSRLRF